MPCTTPMPCTSQNQFTLVSSSSPTKYDVFLSFRGEDTRLNFTGHLYQRLHDHGIITFKDEPELRGGEVISDALLDAIRESKTYIVVLSQNYASSSWCLDELAEILNCHKTMHRLILPVFYRIEPTIVHHQTGSFEQAFKKHQDRFAGEREKVNHWQLTLTEVAGFSGYHISEDRSEADVINKIVDELLLKINPKTLPVADYPVGLDSRVEDITTLLSSGTVGVIKFGIYGMGGVGKTTLAKALFNQLVRGGRFQGSCFLANVREVSRTEKGLVSLQQQLINGVLNSTTKVKVHNVEEGINYIKERISKAKVLVLIDDIYDLEHYESLAGPFSSGIVIITTRDEEMLDKVNVELKYRYKLKELDDAQSLELFTKYAFKRAEAHKNLLVLSEGILRLAGGLPLALKIFGSHLSTKKEVGWKSYIKTLRQHPNSTLEQKLAISLDALELEDRMLKKMFIDIACFFNGWKKERAVKVLDTYYSDPDDKMETLTKRCLLTMNSRNELEMHDLLRDVGRNVARNNAPDEPGKHSRLWLPKDIEMVLKNRKEAVEIEGIIPCDLYNQVALEGKSFTTETFKWMTKLRFLYLKKVNLTGSFQQMFEDLRVLCWDCCPLKCLPSDFYSEELVILELPRSNMRTMWDLNMVSPVFGKLTTLNMSGSEDLIATPDFTKLPCLETLDLHGCKSLETVHVSIGRLRKLVSLNLEGCEKLRSLPDSICNLTALKVLSISKCYSLEAIPTHLGNNTSLTKLNAGRLTVSKLPDSIGNLSELVELNLGDNEKFEILPDSICNLRSLETLDISRCKSLEALPTAIGNIETLKKIIGRGLTISKLPDSIGNLTKLVELDLWGNKKLDILPDTICNLISLEVLNIGTCRSLKALPTAIGNIESLKKIKARGLSVSKLPDSIGSLTKLVELSLSYNYWKLETLPDTICNLGSLEILMICGCEGLETLPDQLWKITRLRKLNASGATMLKKLPDIGSSQIASSLQQLDISSSGITALPSGFSQLSNLEYLDLSGCKRLLSIPELPPNLKRIVANDCISLERIPNLSNLKHLETLDLRDCRGLTEIQGSEELTSIRWLDLGGCCGLTKIRGLEKLTSITWLQFSGSLIAYNHTKRLFQLYSEFGRSIRVYISKLINWESDCDWITESPYWTSGSSESRRVSITVYAHLLPNQSHNFMGIILCFRSFRNYLEEDIINYSVKNTTSGFIWRDRLRTPSFPSGSMMVTVPKSIFSITDDDNTIEFTANNRVKNLGIHLLYDTETEMIEDVAKKHVINMID